MSVMLDAFQLRFEGQDLPLQAAQQVTFFIHLKLISKLLKSKVGEIIPTIIFYKIHSLK